jgi:uncharacterized protein YecE (DUF72 family)
VSAIRVGTCGFSFKDWKGTVYPEKIKDSQMLPYYNSALGFDIVEIDASYYTYMPQRVAQSWLARTDPDFLFAVKCHREMTLNEMGDVDPGEVQNEEAFRKFLFSFEPLAASGRLCCILAQFGPLFFKSKRNEEYLLTFQERMGGLPLVVEFRHRSWLSEDRREDTFDILRRTGSNYAIVDEPKQRTLAPFVPKAVGDIAYFRLHGRSKNWFGAGTQQRYNYFYADEEMKEFIPHIKNLADNVRLCVVLFNNCHAGAALRNAQRMKELLGTP